MKKMKKLAALLLAAALVSSLTACGESSDALLTSKMSEDAGEQNPGVTSYTDPDTGTTYYNGYMGDKLQTAWFTYSVDSAEFVDPAKYPDYTVTEGYKILAVTVTIKNTFQQSIPMSYYDFQIQWDEEDDDAYDYAISTGDDQLDPDQFPDEYELGINESRTGKLLFEVPDDAKDMCLAFAEYYENEDEGNYFFIYFTVK